MGWRMGEKDDVRTIGTKGNQIGSCPGSGSLAGKRPKEGERSVHLLSTFFRFVVMHSADASAYIHTPKQGVSGCFASLIIMVGVRLCAKGQLLTNFAAP